MSWYGSVNAEFGSIPLYTFTPGAKHAPNNLSPHPAEGSKTFSEPR